MSLFQCEECGCVENTALSAQGFKWMTKLFNWDGIEDRKGKLLCCACGPTEYSSGKETEYGVWHDQFDRTFLPLGEFETNDVGNLKHKETGDEDYRKFEIQPSA